MVFLWFLWFSYGFPMVFPNTGRGPGRHRAGLGTAEGMAQWLRRIFGGHHAGGLRKFTGQDG